MRLSDALIYLESKSLDHHLKKWFEICDGANITAKIVSFHFVKELALECWKSPDWGFQVSEGFAAFLADHSGYDPIRIANDFGNYARASLGFKGAACLERFFGPVYLVGLDRTFAEKLRQVIINEDFIDDEALQYELKECSGNFWLDIGYDGVAWLTIHDEFCMGIYELDEYCDLTSKKYRPGKRYALFSLRGFRQLCRPTLIDGSMSFPYFYPSKDEYKWGSTLKASTLESSVPEAIIREGKYLVKLEKILGPINMPFVEPGDASKKNYLRREIASLGKDYPKECMDLLEAWKRSP